MAILPNMSEPTNLFNDSPDTAEVSSFQLAEGDFIVIATDGLWDNLDDSTLVMEISKLKVTFSTPKISPDIPELISFSYRAFFYATWRELLRSWLRKQ